MTGKISATINEAMSLTGLGRTFIYEAIRDQKIQAIKAGRRTLVKVDSLQRYIDSLPTAMGR